MDCVAREENLRKEDMLVADIEELEQMERIRTPRPKAHCIGSVNALKGDKFISQSRMEQSKFWRRSRTWEHPPSSRTAQTEEKNKIIFDENQRRVSSTSRQRLIMV